MEHCCKTFEKHTRIENVATSALELTQKHTSASQFQQTDSPSERNLTHNHFFSISEQVVIGENMTFF